MMYLIEAASDVGNRKKINQDSLCYLRGRLQEIPCAMAVVCDGMGGLSKGELASKAVVQAFSDWFKKEVSNLYGVEDLWGTIRRQWNAILLELHQDISTYAANAHITMGTTITAVFCMQKRYLCVNVGDSRMYFLHPCRQITKDHSLVQREIDRGVLSEEAAEHDSRNSILLQCIGSNKKMVPDFFEGTLQNDDILLLCSDGFRHKLTKDELDQMFAFDYVSSKQRIKKQELRLIETVKQRGELDNITVIILRAMEEGDI